MKSLSFYMSFFLSTALMLFVSNPQSFAQADGETTGGGGVLGVGDAPGTEEDVDSADNGTSLPANTETDIDQDADKLAKENFVKAADITAIDASTRGDLAELRAKIEAIVDISQAAALESKISEHASRCRQYAQKASSCCSDASQCQSNSSSVSEDTFFEQAKEKYTANKKYIDLIGGLGILAVVNNNPDVMNQIGVCMQTANDAINLATKFKTKSKTCGYLREGVPSISAVPGCKSYCAEVDGLVRSFSKEVNSATEAVGGTQKVGLQANINSSYLNNVQSGFQTCVGGTSAKQGDFMTGANNTMNSLNSANNCIAALNPEKEEVSRTTLGSNSDSAEFNGNSDGIQKISSESLDTANLSSTDSDGDELLEGDDEDQKTADNAQDNNQGQNFGGGGFGGGAAASAGAGSGSANNSKKRARRGSSKKDAGLISGYGKSKGSFSKASKKSSYKPRRFSFGSSKKQTKANERAKNFKLLARRLAAAGISPNSQDNIFARASHRFQVSSVKEKLFDARKNKKTWMKK